MYTHFSIWVHVQLIVFVFGWYRHADSSADNDGVEKGCSKPESCSSNSDEDEELHEVEMLLEAYFMRLDKIQNRLNTLCNYTDNTEDYVNIQQDKHRNQLLQVPLILFYSLASSVTAT